MAERGRIGVSDRSVDRIGSYGAELRPLARDELTSGSGMSVISTSSLRGSDRFSRLDQSSDIRALRSVGAALAAEVNDELEDESTDEVDAESASLFGPRGT